MTDVPAVSVSSPASRSNPRTTRNDVEPPPQWRETPPSVSRLAVAIAGYPYSPKAAVLDLCDNSVEAGATNIGIFIKNIGAMKNALVIADNGTGIAPQLLDEVLRAGSNTQASYSRDSLSRYGIGVKGAGFSLGSRITVLTRYADEPLRRRTLDLDQIRASDSWVQDVREPNAEESTFFEWAMEQIASTGSDAGTVVIIDKLNIRTPDKTRLLNDIVRSTGETYAKFLGGRIRMYVDGKEVVPIDPLHRENEETTVLFNQENIALDGGATLIFSAVALPHPLLLSPELRTRYRYKQKTQGIYVYRNNRLIASGETLGLFTKDGHLNAFRAELLYTTSADEHVHVDVAKTIVTMSQSALSRIQDLVNVCTKTANALWRQKDVLTPEAIEGLFDESNRHIASRMKLLVDRIDPKTGKLSKRQPRVSETVSPPSAAPNPPAATAEKPIPKTGEVAYLNPVESLPNGVLYRPRWDGSVNAVVVDVNLYHPFSKAVFSVSPDEANRSVPRKATTAVQQLLFVFGCAEYGFDNTHIELFEQFRQFASLNLSALLAD